MKSLRVRPIILFLFLSLFIIEKDGQAQANTTPLTIDFFGDEVKLAIPKSINIDFNSALSPASIHVFYEKFNQASCYEQVIKTLLNYKKEYKLDDWLYYQLIRRVAQQLSPKKENYTRYTLYKWFLMLKSGFDVRLKINSEKILFYTRSEENIYNIPNYIKDGKQYVCLNYHDYNSQIDFAEESFAEINIIEPASCRSFSYKINSLPAFHPSDYMEKEIRFSLNENEFDFKIKLNSQINSLLINYPVVDYESYFNIPLSAETYNSLIPSLKKTLKGWNVKNGVDYLMRFTRYAFLFGKDAEFFGAEKRLSPEQTMLFEQSDCEDRAALFFYLVKEIYDLPMIVLAFPEHVTIAVQFKKNAGHPIVYNKANYYICDPTPQTKDLKIGELMPQLSKQSYEVVYAYQPASLK